RADRPRGGGARALCDTLVSHLDRRRRLRDLVPRAAPAADARAPPRQDAAARPARKGRDAGRVLGSLGGLASRAVTTQVHIWVLNPGAERELSPSASTTQRTVQQMKAREHLFDGLCAGEPKVWLDELRTPGAPLPSVTDTSPSGNATPKRALLWCPVPAAVRLCRARGLMPQPAPPTSILRQVSSKAFLGAALPA